MKFILYWILYRYRTFCDRSVVLFGYSGFLHQ